MFNKLLNIFKKEKEVPSTIKAPDLMAADPAAGSSVNLMASDPVNSIPVSNVPEKIPEFIEQPGIENQIMDKVPENETPIMIQAEVTPTPNVAPSFDAFSMPAPNPELRTYTPEEIFEKSLTSKICKNCGTPNDPLIKFCVSCGNIMD